MTEDLDLPGDPYASRLLHFFWILDCSSSMSVNGKIGELNFAIREAIPELPDAARSNPPVSLLVRAAAAVGQDASIPMLQEFIGDPEERPLNIGDPKSFSSLIRLVSTTVH